MMNEKDVVDLLKTAEDIGIGVWLDAGWGVDALAGRQSRHHGDLDIFIDRKDVAAVREILISKGYHEVETDHTTQNHSIWHDSEDHQVELSLFEKIGENMLRYESDVFPADELSGKGIVGGLAVRCFTAEAQLKYHLGYAHDEDDAHDVLLLCKTFGLAVPEEYRDDYIKSVTIGEPESLDGKIALSEYNPNWPAMFEQEAVKIRTSLGGRALQLHHAGSTSVLGLCAKPIIDIVLVVADSADEAAYVPDLETVGYKLRIREPDWFEHRMLKGSEPDVNLHVFSENTPEIERMLAFRDHLRNNDGDREKYAQTKRELARQTWTHIQHYADSKTNVIKEIIERALIGDILPILNKTAEALKTVPGVKAVVLGGSRARGTHTADSDVDIGIYYDSTQLDLVGLNKAATELDDQHREKLIASPGEWGEWVNGGGWLVVEGYHVDLLLRDIARVEKAIADCQNGIVTPHYQPGHPHAYISAMYMGELAISKMLWDSCEVSRLKAIAEIYPPKLKAAIIGLFTFEAGFSVMFAEHSAAKDDGYYVYAHLVRVISCLNQVLFALNEQYCLNEKKAVIMIEGFEVKPANYKRKVDTIFTLAAANQPESCAKLRELIDEIEVL